MTNHCVLLLDNFVVKLAGTYSILQLQISLVIKPTQKPKEDSLYLQLIFIQREESCHVSECYVWSSIMSSLTCYIQNKHSSFCIFSWKREAQKVPTLSLPFPTAFGAWTKCESSTLTLGQSTPCHLRGKKVTKVFPSSDTRRACYHPKYKP